MTSTSKQKYTHPFLLNQHSYIHINSFNQLGCSFYVPMTEKRHFFDISFSFLDIFCKKTRKIIKLDHLYLTVLFCFLLGNLFFAYHQIPVCIIFRKNTTRQLIVTPISIKNNFHVRTFLDLNQFPGNFLNKNTAETFTF